MSEITTPNMLSEQDSLQRRIDAAEDEPDVSQTTREQRLALALDAIIREATRVRQLPITDSFRDGYQQGWSAARTIAVEALDDER